jgi:glucose/arabinose dehydrogenase
VLSSRWAYACAGLGIAALLVVLTSCGAAASEPSADTRTGGSTSAGSPTQTRTGGSTSAGSPTQTRTGGSAAAGSPTVSEVASGLTSPWGLVALADGSTLVSERDTRRILHLVDGQVPTPLLTIDDARPAGEGGLLGLAATQDQQTVFAYYTAENDNRLASMSWDGQHLGEPTVILSGIPKGGRHNGGRLALGPDGQLYVSTGESGDAGLAQDTKSLGGKILRITTAGKPAPGNPFGNEVYSYGHRNVQGLAFDDEGRLWASELGEQSWDELNLITEGGNYGWPQVEGSSENKDLINPKVVWETSAASPSGLAYWRGKLWMAALRGQQLWEIPLRGTTPGSPVGHFADKYGRLRSVTVTHDGSSLLLSSSNTDGRGDQKSGDDRLLKLTG